MATTFLEPGGDSTFNLATTANGGFWQVVSGSVSIVTDFVHGNHVKSIKAAAGAGNHYVTSPNGVVADAGSRFSGYFYLNALPNATAKIFGTSVANDGSAIVTLKVTSAGVLQLYDTSVGAQLGSDGPTLSTATWYRISIAFTITSTTVNRFEVFVNGTSVISVTNATITRTGSSDIFIGNDSGNATLDVRLSDLYVDNSAALTDPGNIWVTAKRPNANGTTNAWTTQIGAGGSGYGTGHSPQVNERPNSDTNGWSEVSLTNTIEEYSIEGKSTGDIDVTGATFVDFCGWVRAKSTASETARLILVGVTSNIALTTTITNFTAFSGTTTYPAGSTDIGIESPGVSVQTESLYECGIMVAYIPAAVTTKTFKTLLGAGNI